MESLTTYELFNPFIMEELIAVPSYSQVWKKNSSRLLAKRFRSLYLDPLNSKSEIMEHLNISRSTYYRLASELGAPVFTVGLLDIRDFSNHGSRILEKNPGWLFEFDVARSIGLCWGARLEIKFIKPRLLNECLQKRTIDFAITSYSATPKRQQEMSFSNSYMSKSYGGGQFYKVLNSQQSSNKNVLGVIGGHVHEEYARTHFRDNCLIRSYKSLDSLKASVIKGNVDYVFLHPDSIIFEDIYSKVVEEGKFIIFPWDTCMPLHLPVEQARELNSAIEQIQSSKILEQLENSLENKRLDLF